MIAHHNADINNFRFGEDEITLLSDTLALDTDEAEHDNGYIGSSLMNRFNKLKEKTMRWEGTSYFFP